MILERLFVKSLSNYMDDNNLLKSDQHNFRCSRSTVTNLLSFDKYIVEFLNNGSACDVSMIDFCRAFDKVDHTVLCDKLKEAGIDGCYLKWMVDYLQDRKQFVEYNGTRSALYDVTSGVVQGICIGPCAFTIFVLTKKNCDLSSVLQHSKSALYADDFKFIGDVSTPQDRRLMQAHLDAVARWSADNRLPISFQKSFTQHFCKNNIKQQYSVHGSVIKSTSSYADLGVLRCDDFSYDQYNHDDALKTSRLSGMTLKLFSTRD